MSAHGRKALYAAINAKRIDTSIPSIRPTDPLDKQIDTYCDVLRGFLVARGFQFIGWTPIKATGRNFRPVDNQSEIGESLASAALWNLRASRAAYRKALESPHPHARIAQMEDAAKRALAGGVLYARAYSVFHDARFSAAGPARRKEATEIRHQEIADEARRLCGNWKSTLRPSAKQLYDRMPKTLIDGCGIKAFSAILKRHQWREWTWGRKIPSTKGH